MTTADDFLREAGSAVEHAAQLSRALAAQIAAARESGSREPETHRAASTTPANEPVEGLAARLSQRTQSSKRYAQRYRGVLADSRAVVGFRPVSKEMHYPIVGRAASGARIEDIDGNSYVDVTMGFGALLFGHDPDFVTHAVRDHLSRGIQLGPRSADTGEAAELLSTLTGFERVAFAVSGTEANSAAIRLARAATGRSKLVMFRGSYHGHLDSVLGRPGSARSRWKSVPVSPGIPESAVAELLVLDYGDQESLNLIERQSGEIAAVIVEPVQCRNPSLRPKEFVISLREITRRHGIVLLFDEMITGFRTDLRGAQSYYNVKPDLATYGKALGSGFPIGAIAGRADIMDGVDGGYWQYGDESRPAQETTFFGGTYIQHPLSMAAAKAVLTHLQDHSPALQQQLNARTDRLAETLNQFFAREEFPLKLDHFGSMFRFTQSADMDLLYRDLLLRGLYVWEWRSCYLSTAHADGDIEFIVDAVTSSLREMRDAGVISDTRSRRTRPAPRRAPDFSIYFFGNYDDPRPGAGDDLDGYGLISEIARFADQHSFHSLWIPERHFDSLGGLFPSPALLAASLSRETRNIRLNAGSVILPLNDPVRIAEEWSVVDNLSGGRVGLGCGSGWNADDFIFFPDRFERRREKMFEHLEVIRKLWRGEHLTRNNGKGQERSFRIYPRPVQGAPPMFLATTGNAESFEQAARHDLGIVTNLAKQDIEQLAENIARYRQTRARHGLDPESGRVAVLLHTYLGTDHASARTEALEPMRGYLRSSLVLHSAGREEEREPSTANAEDLDYLFRRAYDRYCDRRALIGTPETCAPTVEALRDAGVDEIAALVDFGLPAPKVRSGLSQLDLLRRRFHEPPLAAPVGENSAPATAAQRQLWLACQLTGPSAYNEVQAARLRGTLDVAALRAAIQALADRHDALRTSFRADGPGGELRQYTTRHAQITMPVVDAEGADPSTAIADTVQASSERQCDLAREPLFAPVLLKLGTEDHVLILGIHHMISDAHSASILAADLAQSYRAAVTHRPSHFGSPAGSALDSAADPVPGPGDLGWWRAHVGGEPAVLRLPADWPRDRQAPRRGQCISTLLDARILARLQAWSAAQHVTLLATLSAAWRIVLRRFSGQDEFILGTTFDRRDSESRNTVGFFAALLPLRGRLSDELSLPEAALAARDTLLQASEHANVSLDELLTEINPDPGSAHPLMPVSIDLGTDALSEIELPGLQAEAVDNHTTSAPLELALMATRSRAGLQLSMRYDSGLYAPATVRRYLAHLDLVLTQIAAGSTARIGELPLLTSADQTDLARWSGSLASGASPPRPLSTRRTGDQHKAALVDGDVRWSRDKLDTVADAVAAELAAVGVARQDIVAVLVPKGPTFAAAVLGAVRAGAAYLPLDLEQPPPRLSAMLADAGAAAVLYADPAPANLAAAAPRIRLDADLASAPAGPEHPRRADDLLCLIYTSGSTGVPKGVEIEHRNMGSLLAACHDELAVTEHDRLAWYCSVGFDLSHLELWSALVSGAPLHVVPDDIRLDPPRLVRWMAEQQITIAWVPTAIGEAIIEQPWPERTALRVLGVGGEQLNTRPPHDLPFAVINIYGPAECTVFCVRGEVTPVGSGPPSIGTPTRGTCVEIRDQHGRLLPPGVVGEMYLGGPQIGRGYHNDPGLTQRRIMTVQGRRWFRSGDLARWGTDGRLHFIGRSDDQVKIRGVRVEPAEVTSAVRSLAGIRDARVTSSTDPATGHGMLCCHVVPDAPVADPSLQIKHWRAQLSAHLPRQMIPDEWILAGALPLTSHGKRARHPEPGQTTASLLAPHDDDSLLSAVKSEWQTLLSISDLPDGATFFDLGGHSITAIRLLNRIYEKFGVHYPMSTFFAHPTVHEMAERLRSQGDVRLGSAGDPPVRGEL